MARWSSSTATARSSVAWGLARIPDGSLAARPMRRDAEIDAEDASAAAGHPTAARTAESRSPNASSIAPTFWPPPCTTSACLAVPPPSAFAASRAMSAADAPAVDPVLAHRDREPRLGAVAVEARQRRRSRSPARRGSRSRACAARRESGRRAGPRRHRRPRRPPTSPPPRPPDCARSAASSSCSCFTCSSSRSTRSGSSAGATLSVSARSRSCTSSSWMRASAPSPVTASMRRRLAPIEPSLTILIGPMKPSACTCVPPHSSIECSPASSTRTRSPYLSPKNAIAPSDSGVLLGGLVVAHGRVADDLGVGQRLDAVELLAASPPRGG